MNKALKRQHILEGYLIALKNIDDVLNIIRNANDINMAKDVLIKNFNLSQEQVVAITEMRFKSLTNMEQEKLSEEHKEISDLSNKYKNILEDKNKLYDVLKSELEVIKNKYASLLLESELLY